MGAFADRYIENNVVFSAFIPEKPLYCLSVIIMIPCLEEPEIVQTLESLWNCLPIQSPCEVIVTVNNSESAAAETKDFNQKTYRQLQEWKKRNDRPNLILHPIWASSLNAKHAGAGLARKIGMDEAIRRFNLINKPDGIIISTDADCLFSPNYLEQIEKVFAEDKSCFAATLNFKHRFDEMTDAKQRLGIQLYEDYLHYYKKALDFAGFPDSIYTIGSAFAVRADAYVKQGGMNRRQAGEDFYFLNKLTKLGKIKEISDAYVYPSARTSNRVPFGTGAAMTKWMNGTDDLNLTYNFDAFSDLKMLFDQVDLLYGNSKEYTLILPSLPEAIRNYLHSLDFQIKLTEIIRNSASLTTFRKRFFQFFDAFVIMRFLNLSHPKYYQWQILSTATSQLREQTAKAR